MEADERIGRMERAGVIDARQAEQLRASLRTSAGAVAPKRLARLAWPVAVAVVLALVMVILVVPAGTQTVQDVSQTLNDAGAHGAMNRSLLNAIAAGLLVLIPVGLVALVYNGLVNREEAVFKSWAQVESQLQRRADLVPGLVEVVSDYARHERETLQDVTSTRGDALVRSVRELVRSQSESAALLTGSDLLDDQQQMDRLAEAQREVGRHMAGVLALAEDYPELRASDQYLELQAQLEGTENRINVARMQFNEAVADFNASIRRLPGTLVAGMGNFRRKAYFQSDASADAAPGIDLQGR